MPTRRKFLARTAGALALPLIPGGSLLAAPGFRRPPGVLRDRPRATSGLQTGDPTSDGVILWSHCDRPARLVVEVSPTESFASVRTVRGPVALPETGGTVKFRVPDLPAGSDVFFRAHFVDLEDPTSTSAPMLGHTRTAPVAADRDLTVLWSGDTCGQGWGIDESRGGMTIYRSMQEEAPDLFLHCGDLVYADGPLPETKKLPDGSTWTNLVTPAKAKVAETLDEFRGQYAYNFLDAHVRNFAARVPQVVAWDDHETVNNWYPGEVLDDDRYTVKSVDLLAARARRALHEWTPTAQVPGDPERIHRKIAYGPRLDIFVLDMRSFRGPNGPNREEEASARTAFLGAEQMEWFARELAASRATWKLIVADMPLGLVVGDGKHFENCANGPGKPLGRELEIAKLLGRMKRDGVENVVWLTADVHYTAAHHYAPERASFADFTPFWEFVSGPLHAGTFGPNALDPTFGPKVVFQDAPEPGQGNLPPSAGKQFYGKVTVPKDGSTLKVELKDREGAVRFTQVVERAG